MGKLTEYGKGGRDVLCDAVVSLLDMLAQSGSITTHGKERIQQALDAIEMHDE